MKEPHAAQHARRLAAIPFYPARDPLMVSETTLALEDLEAAPGQLAAFVSHLIRNWREWQGIAAMMEAWHAWREANDPSPAPPPGPPPGWTVCPLCDNLGVTYPAWPDDGRAEPCPCPHGAPFRRNPCLARMYRRPLPAPAPAVPAPAPAPKEPATLDLEPGELEAELARLITQKTAKRQKAPQ